MAGAEREVARSGLNGLDALHVAVASALGADESVTTKRSGKAVHRAMGIRVVSIHRVAVA